MSEIFTSSGLIRDRDIELQYQFDHPRKNATIYNFPIGCIQDDMIVIDYRFYPSTGMVPVVQCQICGRVKEMSAACLRKHTGTTHHACGQFEKTSDPRFYKIWEGLKQRMYNPNYWRYDRYGGRGLQCDYDLFIDFYDDMYSSYVSHCNQYGEKDTKIDRINNNYGYIRGNLRWATQKEQVNNSTKMSYPFVAISPEGKEYFGRNQTDFAKEHGLNPKQLNAVLIGRYNSTCGWKAHFINSSDERCND